MEKGSHRRVELAKDVQVLEHAKPAEKHAGSVSFPATLHTLRRAFESYASVAQVNDAERDVHWETVPHVCCLLG